MRALARANNPHVANAKHVSFRFLGDYGDRVSEIIGCSNERKKCDKQTDSWSIKIATDIVDTRTGVRENPRRSSCCLNNQIESFIRNS